MSALTGHWCKISCFSLYQVLSSHWKRGLGPVGPCATVKRYSVNCRAAQKLRRQRDWSVFSPRRKLWIRRRKKILNTTEGGEFEALMLLEAKLTFHHQLLVSGRNIFIVLRILIVLEFSTWLNFMVTLVALVALAGVLYSTQRKFYRPVFTSK